MIYKISVLLMLSQVEAPLSNTQITQFYLDREYTDYFTIQQTISELVAAGLIHEESTHNSTNYTLSEEGENTLCLMRDKVSHAMADDITSYLRENGARIRLDQSLSANYDAASGGGYIAHCRYVQNGHTMLDLSLHAATAEQAETICNNWKARYEDAYISLMDALIQ